jgi:hypothetical protein
MTKKDKTEQAEIYLAIIDERGASSTASRPSSSRSPASAH